jgi:superfamily II DNA or RNA helicase
MISITINNKIHLNTHGISDTVVQQIKNELTTLNPEWLRKRIAKIYLGNTEERINFYKEKSNELVIPRGFVKRLSVILSPYNPSYRSKDNTRLLDNVSINMKPPKKTKIDWSFQDEAIEHLIKEPSAVLNFATGGGKTVTGIKLICKRQQPTLIIVHSKELLNQWRGDLLEFTNINEDNIGLIGDGNNTVGLITIGIINSLYKKIKNIKHLFGQVIIDEVHRLPGRCFREIVGEMDSYYILGLSATPKRSDSQTKVIFFYCGEQEYEIKPPKLIKKGVIVKPRLIPKQTEFEFDPTDGKKCPSGGDIGEDFDELGKKCKDCQKKIYTDCYMIKKILKNEWLYMLDKLIDDDERNNLIINDVLAWMSTNLQNGTPLVVSDRIKHCLQLEKLLKEKSHHLNIRVLTSFTPNKERRKIINETNSGNVDILIAGCKLIGEGFDCKHLSVLFLATPISFDGRLVQYIGRILRPMKGKNEALIYDYLDIKVPMLKKSFNKRKKGYRHEGIEI